MVTVLLMVKYRMITWRDRTCGSEFLAPGLLRLGQENQKSWKMKLLGYRLHALGALFIEQLRIFV